MKKQILGATFVVAMMAVAGYNVYMSQTKFEMSELALANVEALANPEGNDKIGSCDTDEKYVTDTMLCPNGIDKSGFIGTEYKRKKGTKFKYKKGRTGTCYSCQQVPGATGSCDNTKWYDC